MLGAYFTAEEDQEQLADVNSVCAFSSAMQIC